MFGSMRQSPLGWEVMSKDITSVSLARPKCQ